MHYNLQLQHFTFNEISTGIYVPDAAQVQQWYNHQKHSDDTAMFPYWSKIWPAAYAMAAFLTEHPHFIINKNVLELGAGLGLPSLAAARYAASVCSSDHAADAIAVIEQSVAYNKLTNMEVQQLDWQKLPQALNADVVLLSDVNYEPEKFDALYNMLTNFLHNNALAILSTPQRLMAKSFIEKIMPYITWQQNINVNEDDAIIPATVFVLRKIQ